MLNIARWKIILIVSICVLAFLYAAPNLVGSNLRASLQTLPGWLPTKTVNLGLDLQGGSHLLLEVDVDYVIRERAENLVQTARPELRKNKIGYTRISSIPGGIRLTLRDDQDPAPVRKILRGIDQDIEVLSSEDKKIVEAKLTEVAITKIQDQTIDQSIEIVRRRVDETGTREPAIQRQGEDRIIVQLPGVDDPERIKEILGKTAQLTFHLVETSVNSAKIRGTRKLPMAENPAQTISVERRPMITGDMLTNAQPSFQEGRPIVSFALNGIGARKFCDVTREHTNEPFAIVLDSEVISAPNINEPICGGAAQISGQFTVEETNDLALLLRAGALPAPLKVLEERTVGPSLGADSIEAGKKAGAFAVVLVLIFMVIYYGRFGMMADVALVVNMALVFAILSALQATLTLPGIAGIVLTIGMAVDANVLIFERIREEVQLGRSPISAIDIGYNRAMTTIIDSNLTTLIAGIVLYSVGAGPIKGFAVTLMIGIVTSMFSAIWITRLMVIGWLRRKKPESLPI